MDMAQSLYGGCLTCGFYKSLDFMPLRVVVLRRSELALSFSQNFGRMGGRAWFDPDFLWKILG